MRGNIDTQPWADRLPETDTVQLATRKCYVLHDIAQLAIDPVRAGFAAVIFGHSHKPLVEMRNGILYLNPGSAGPRRFNLPICLARIVVSDQSLEPSLVRLSAS